MSFPVKQLFRFDDFELNSNTRQLLRNGAPVALSPKGFEVLIYLVSNPGRVIGKEELLTAIWPGSFVEESSLSQQISLLRKALTDKSSYIVTIPGRGYQFTGSVQAESSMALVEQHHSAQMMVQTVRERTHLVLDTSPLPLHAGQQPLSVVKVSLWAAAVLALAVSAWVGWTRYRHPALTQPLLLVIADFINTTGDPAFDGTLQRALDVDLTQSPYMDALTERESVSTLQLMGLSKDSPITSAAAREICQRTNREVMLAGAVSSVGSTYQLTLKASDCASGKNLVSAKTNARTREDVLEALDRLAEQIRSGLNESAKSVQSYEVPLREATTPSLDALKAYSVGTYVESQGGPKTESIAAYQRATELDPKFAMAYYMLGIDNNYLGQADLATQYFTRAFELSDHVSMQEQLAIRAAYYAEAQHDVIAGIKANQLWASIYPQDALPVGHVVDGYMTLGQWNAAVAAGEHGMKLFPEDSLMYQNMGTIYRSVHRFGDSDKAVQMAVRVGKGNVGEHMQYFENALYQRDEASLARESEWFDAHDDGATVLYYPSLRGDALAGRGSLNDGEKLFQRAYDAANRAKLPEAAGLILINEAVAEYKLGFVDRARSTLQRVQGTGKQSPDFAIAQAELGDTSSAEKFLASHSSPTADTLMMYAYLPQIRAAIAMQRGKPLEAIAALEPARPYEMRDYLVLSLRGEAYLQAGQADMAQHEFERIVANPGIDTLYVYYPLAQLGVARAYAMQHNAVESRREYEALFSLWKNANQNLPVLQQARLEFKQLGAGRQ